MSDHLLDIAGSIFFPSPVYCGYSEKR
jgi:hypothetical protein